MAQCPNCSQNIAITEDHFGTLYRCEHCKVEFFIGFDGAPENSKEASPDDKEVEQPERPELPQVPDLYNLNAAAAEHPSDNNNMMTLPDMPPLVGGTESVAMPENAATPIAAEVKIENPFANFTQDVREFGNEVALSGVLSFDLEIAGIDLGETRQELIEALDDKRFGWNLEELNQNIKDGKLVLKNLSAPKIIVLVKRISSIGLSLNWRHNVSTQ